MKREKKVLDTKGKKVAVILIVILLLILVVAVAYKFILKKNKNVDNFLPELSGDVKSGEVIEEIADERENLKMNNLDFKINSGEDINKKDEINIDGLKAINFKIGLLENSTLITGELENTTNKPIQNIKLLFIMYDSDGNVVHQNNIILPETIEVNEVRSVETSIGVRYENISSIEVKITDYN